MMIVHKIIEALSLPSSSRVDQRIPKTVLIEKGAATASDKRHIKEGIEVLWWLAALKPRSIGVTPFKDEAREYLEISVLHGLFRPKAKVNRLLELIHRAIPYPVFFIVEHEATVSLSLAHKRRAQNEADRMVLEDGFPHTTVITDDAPDVFFGHLALNNLPNTDLFTLYQGWLDALVALEAYRISGEFHVKNDLEYTLERRETLRNIQKIELEIERLRKRAKKERQIARQVELNLKIRELEARRQNLLRQL